MPRTYSSIEKIRAELAWVTETRDPNKCGCRNLRCCEESGHKPGACPQPVATKFWTFRWQYYCAPCREYGCCGSSLVAIWQRDSGELLLARPRHLSDIPTFRPLIFLSAKA